MNQTTKKAVESNNYSAHVKISLPIAEYDSLVAIADMVISAASNPGMIVRNDLKQAIENLAAIRKANK